MKQELARSSQIPANPIPSFPPTRHPSRVTLYRTAYLWRTVSSTNMKLERDEQMTWWSCMKKRICREPQVRAQLRASCPTTAIMYTGLHQLPPSLWALIVSFALLPPAAAQTSLTLNNVLQLANTTSSSSAPLLLSLPSTSSLLSVSIALCASASSSGLSFFVTNSSTVSTPGPGGGTDVFQLDLGDDGVGNWTGVMTESGKLAVYSLAATDSMQIAASDNGAFRSISVLRVLM
jgi:hypothetical protein